MACFLVPTAEAVAVTAVKKHLAHTRPRLAKPRKNPPVPWFWFAN